MSFFSLFLLGCLYSFFRIQFCTSPGQTVVFWLFYSSCVAFPMRWVFGVCAANFFHPMFFRFSFFVSLILCLFVYVCAEFLVMVSFSVHFPARHPSVDKIVFMCGCAILPSFFTCKLDTEECVAFVFPYSCTPGSSTGWTWSPYWFWMFVFAAHPRSF